jgi:hypothetical protein
VDVIEQESHLVLPGLTVRLYATQSPDVFIGTTTTDENGHAAFKLGSAYTDTFNRDNVELAVEILTPAGNCSRQAVK